MWGWSVWSLQSGALTYGKNGEEETLDYSCALGLIFPNLADHCNLGKQLRTTNTQIHLWPVKVKVIVASCLTVWDPIECSLPSSSVYGILQARTLEWVASPFSRGSSWLRDWTQVSCNVGRFFTIWATRKPHLWPNVSKSPGEQPRDLSYKKGLSVDSEDESDLRNIDLWFIHSFIHSKIDLFTVLYPCMHVSNEDW